MIPLFAAGQHDVEQFLLRILLQLIVIVVAARAGGWLFRRIGQPQVCGEIAAGILLGPSCFGLLAPGTWSALFPQDSDLGIVMKVLAEIGLILLMFLMGQDFEFGQLRKIGPQALAVSITAIPVLGRIMMEFDLTRTRIGVLTITAAAVDDATGWILLAAVSAVVLGNLVPSTIVVMLAATLAFCAVVLLVVRPLAKRLIQRSLARNNGDITLGGLAWLLVAVFTAAVATNLIGIFSIFGPFVLGAALWDEHDFREAVRRRLRDFVTVFFLPIFFTYTGLRTRVTALDSGELWLYCG